jgi:predicted DNA-binding transcriptional regulator AlpA
MLNHNNHIPEYVSMTQMAQILNLSRSRFYQLVDDNFFLKPLHLTSNRRPVYSREMVLENISFRKNNFGANKKIVVFYSSRNPSVVTTRKKRTKKNNPIEDVSTNGKHSELIDTLEGLGLGNVTVSQIESALKECFPEGTKDIDESEILRAVYKYVKRQNCEHKHRT